MIVTDGSVNVSVPFYFVDDVGGTNPGEPTTGLLFSNIETGGSASYQRQGAARVDFELVTQTAAGAHTDGGFVLIDDTEMPGVYRCDIPDAAVAAGVDFVIIYLRAATASNTITRPLKIDLTAVDLRDSVRGGMTSLPNAAADAAGGLPISDAGGLDVDNRMPSATAITNLDLMYDGTGYTDATAPASRSQVDSIGAASGGSVNIEATEDNTGGAIDPSSAAFVGSVQSGTFASTESEDGTLHDIDDTANDIDIVYGFNVGGSRVATEISFAGFVQGTSDEMKIKVYDHVGAGWDIVGTIDGQSGSSNVSLDLPLLMKHTGTAGELGKVYIRIETDSTTPSNLSIDKLLVSAVANASSLGFVGGAVWVDTANGTSGTGEGVGTISIPSDNIADAKTIADNNNLRLFHVLPQSSITLASNFDGYEFVGFGYSVTLDGQSVSGTSFNYAIILGNDSGSNAVRTTYINCDIDGSTLGIHNALSCRLSGDMVLAEAGDYYWDQCFSAIAGTGSPSVDFEAAAETKALSIRHYSGGMEFKNFGNTGTHTASIEGAGQVILNASCAGGIIAIRGNFTVTDNAGGAVTLSDDARIDVGQINAECDTAISDAALATAASVADIPTTAEFEARTILAASYFDPAVDTVATVTTLTNLPTITTDWLTADGLAADAVDEIRDGLLPTQNAGFNNIQFIFVAASDHVTPVTGATGMAVTRSIDGGAFSAGTGTGPAEISNGLYQYDASAADMNGGIITFRFTASGGTPGAADDRFLTIVTGGGV